jgi:hypothetical protein
MRRAVLVTAVATPVLVSASPVFATVKVPGQHYTSLGLLNTILLFVVTPLAVFFVVGALAALPSTLAIRRSRSIKTWDHEPIWISTAATKALPVATPTQLPFSVDVPVWVQPVKDSRQLVTAGTSKVPARGGASAEW